MRLQRMVQKKTWFRGDHVSGKRVIGLGTQKMSFHSAHFVTLHEEMLPFHF
jgi:hypothetical protein